MRGKDKKFRVDLTGRKFGKLTVIGFSHKKDNQNFWLCKCDCGNELNNASTGRLTNSLRSCGCLIMEKITKHGFHGHPLYYVYHGMRKRCYDPNTKWYGIYGGRGVRMCDEWKNNPKSFFDWAINCGWERGLQLDKDTIPKRLGIPAILYSPEYCCFVTPKENSNAQSTNVILTLNGESLTISQWAEKLKISATKIRNRYYKKRYSAEEILSINPLIHHYGRKKNTEKRNKPI